MIKCPMHIYRGITTNVMYAIRTALVWGKAKRKVKYGKEWKQTDRMTLGMPLSVRRASAWIMYMRYTRKSQSKDANQNIYIRIRNKSSIANAGVNPSENRQRRRHHHQHPSTRVYSASSLGLDVKNRRKRKKISVDGKSNVCCTHREISPARSRQSFPFTSPAVPHTHTHICDM